MDIHTQILHFEPNLPVVPPYLKPFFEQGLRCTKPYLLNFKALNPEVPLLSNERHLRWPASRRPQAGEAAGEAPGEATGAQAMAGEGAWATYRSGGV